jgi:hypothetical protein
MLLLGCRVIEVTWQVSGRRNLELLCLWGI